MNYYSFIKEFHSGWAYIVVLSSVLLLGLMLYTFLGKKTVSPNLRKVSFYTVLSFHIQFLVGIVLYCLSPTVQTAWESGSAMVAGNRLYTVEHPFMMFTAVILITIGNAKLKKSTTIKSSTFAFIGLALLCFYMIPWRVWIG